MNAGLVEPFDEVVADAILDAVGAAGIGLVVMDSDPERAEALYVCAAASAILGRRPEELLGMPLPGLIPAAPVGARRQEGAGPKQFEAAIVRADGVRAAVGVAMSPVEHDGRRLAVNFIRDLTERHDAERALSRSEAQFRRLIEAVPEAIWIFDGSGLCFANAAAARLFGVEDPKDAMGADPRLFAHPEDVPVLEQSARAILTRRERLAPYEYRARRSDGSWMALEVSSIAIEYEGRPAVLSFAREVTERKQLEAQTLQADRLATLGMLAGGMAHAINNPLTYVLLNLDHLSTLLPKLAIDPKSSPEALQRLDEVCEGAQRVAAVVRRMRAFARSDDLEQSGVSTREALDVAIEMVGNEIRHRGRLVTEYQDVPPVLARQARLEQALLNLLLHAAQTLPEDAGSGAAVKVGLRTHGDRVLVEVHRSGSAAIAGAGVPEDPSRPRPEAPFDHVEDVGLAICRSIVASLGGELSVARNEGGGASYRVLLPAAESRHDEAPSKPANTAPSIPPPRVARARVLVVDDDPGVGSALRLMLEDENDVTFVADGREALKYLLGEDAYDVVFCDLMMPEMNGIDIYQALRLNRPGYERRIVFMTGGAFTQDAERFLGQAPNPRLEKPFDLRTLRRIVRQAAEVQR
jgi:two-component system cell cycle sensor histidine kinase/response regulator CckA